MAMERYPGSRLDLLSAPSHPSLFLQGSGTMRISLPITVAGQQRVCPTYASSPLSLTGPLQAAIAKGFLNRASALYTEQSEASSISPHEHVSSKKDGVLFSMGKG